MSSLSENVFKVHSDADKKKFNNIKNNKNRLGVGLLKNVTDMAFAAEIR